MHNILPFLGVRTKFVGIWLCGENVKKAPSAAWNQKAIFNIWIAAVSRPELIFGFISRKNLRFSRVKNFPHIV